MIVFVEDIINYFLKQFKSFFGIDKQSFFIFGFGFGENKNLNVCYEYLSAS